MFSLSFVMMVGVLSLPVFFVVLVVVLVVAAVVVVLILWLLELLL